MHNTLFIRRWVLREEEQGQGAGNGGASPAAGVSGDGGAAPAAAAAGGEPAGGTPAGGDGGTPPGDGGPEFNEDAAARLQGQYSLTEPDDGAGAKAADDGGEYRLEFSREFLEGARFGEGAGEVLNGVLGPIARESGVSADVFGKLFERSYSAVVRAQEEAQWRRNFQDDADLKRDWGAEYEANMREARLHAAWIVKNAGVTEADLAVFQSPKGMRVLHALARAHVQPAAAGVGSAGVGEAAWADAVLKPGHPDHDAFGDPLDPRYRELNERWMRAKGGA